MPADRGQYAQENDELLFLGAFIGIPILLLVLWHFVGRYVYVYDRIALYGLLSAWGWFPTDWPVLGWFTRQFLFFRYTPPEDILFTQHAVRESLIVNGVVVFISAVIVVRRALYISRAHPYAVFGRTMNIYDYVDQQKPMYPHLRVMWKLRLLGRPLKEGLFRMGDSAKEFAIRNDLVRLIAVDADPVLDEKKARRAFEGHLGAMLPMPTGDRVQDAKKCLARLDNNEKAVLAAIVPRLAVCDADVPDAEFDAALALSNKLVEQFWIGFDSYNPAPPTDADHKKNPDMPLVPPPPPVDTTGCDAVLLKYLAFPRVHESMVAHAYVRTFIYDALQACRRVGKFSPTRFRWLRMKDRKLWLTINSAGRNTPFWEVAGLHAHYLWERKAKTATERPQVAEAVVALRDEVDAVLFTRKQRERIWEAQGKVPVAVAASSKDKPAAPARARPGPVGAVTPKAAAKP